MEKEFVPFDLALELKELGFNEPCFGYYDIQRKMLDTVSSEVCERLCKNDTFFKSPTYSQAFRWLYQKLGIEKGVMPLDTESQQLLLKELIDKVSSKHLLV